MIYITGDTHGTMNVSKLYRNNFKDYKKLTKDDYVIICGDFGGIFYCGEKDRIRLDWWEEQPWTTLWVDGNHENFDEISKYHVEEWHGGKVQFIRPHVIHLMRGQIYEIDGSKFFTFGGGLSIDQIYRIEHRSWWKEEEPSYLEMNEAIKNLEKHNFEVDYIITHAAPQTLVRNEIKSVLGLRGFDCLCEKFLDEVFYKTKYKEWFCGHYHGDIRISSVKLNVLYETVVRLSHGLPIVGDGRLKL